jgi:hypothetical protein
MFAGAGCCRCGTTSPRSPCAQWCIDHAPNAAIEAKTVDFLAYLGRTAEIPGAGPVLGGEQIAAGFRRAAARLPDIVLDAPGAPATLSALVRATVAAGLLPPDFEFGAGP